MVDGGLMMALTLQYCYTFSSQILCPKLVHINELKKKYSYDFILNNHWFLYFSLL